VGLGELHSLDEVRAIAQNVPTHVFSPQKAQFDAWNEAAQRFSTITVM